MRTSEEKTEFVKRAGYVAYTAYGAVRGNKTHDGREMPKWDDLGEEIQSAWIMAAAAVTLFITQESARRKAEKAST